MSDGVLQHKFTLECIRIMWHYLQVLMELRQCNLEILSTLKSTHWFLDAASHTLTVRDLKRCDPTLLNHFYTNPLKYWFHQL